MSRLSTWKLSAEFYESYKSFINYHKDSTIRDKIKGNLVRIRYNSINNNRTFEREKNRLNSQFIGTYGPKKIKGTLL